MNTQKQLAIFAAVLWDAADLIELRPLPCDKGRRLWIKAGELQRHAERLQRENDAGANLYAGVLPRTRDGGGLDKDCAPGRVLWCDLDNVTTEELKGRIAAESLPEPTLLIGSGHGAHAYWKLTEKQDPAILSELVGDLAVFLDSDPTVKNASRIMRLPGFKNHKEPVADCQIVEARPGLAYDFRELRQLIPHVEQTAGVPPAPTVPNRPENGDNLVKRAAAYGAKVEGVGKGSRNRTGFRLSATLLNDFGLDAASAWPILVDWNRKNSPPLSEVELRAVLESGGRYAKNPAGAKAAERPKPKPQAHREIPTEPRADVLREIDAQIAAEQRGELRPIHLDFAPRTSGLAKLLAPGSVAVVAGPTGDGKSFYGLACALAAEKAGHSWSYLPLESDAAYHVRRLGAILDKSFDAVADVEDDPNAPAKAKAAMDRQRAALARIAGCVHENPYRPGKDGEIFGAVTGDSVSRWIEARLKTDRLVILDPLAQVEFAGHEQWRSESAFMRRLVALAASSKGTILVIAHTIKRPEHDDMGPGDLEGAANLSRLASALVLLKAHPVKDSMVWRPGGHQARAEHNRTLFIAKARNGAGTQCRIAFNFGKAGPVFEELGVMVPKGQRAPDFKDALPEPHWANE